jgi:peptidoglycan/LPS O-acetylase OafA/YrhL
MKKLEYITILRGVAILSVLLIHVKLQSSGILYLNPYLVSLIDNGARGVQLFYLLSAFTLFRSFNQRGSVEKRPVTNYFIRRFFRIAPLYYLAIIYYLWQDGTGSRYWLGNASHITTYNILSNFTFLHGFNPYWITSLVPGGWSIAVEVLFYVSLPLLARKIKGLQQAYYFLIVTLILRFVLLLFFTRHVLISDDRLWREYLILYFPNQLPIFGLGIVLYFLVEGLADLKLSSKSLLAGAFVLIVGTSLGGELLIPNIFYFGVGFVLLVLALRKYRPVIFFNAVFRYIGKVSYTIYLTHWAAIFLLHKFSIFNLLPVYNEPLVIVNYLLNYLLVVSVSITISTMIYYTIESPMQRVGKSLIDKMERRSRLLNKLQAV